MNSLAGVVLLAVSLHATPAPADGKLVLAAYAPSAQAKPTKPKKPAKPALTAKAKRKAPAHAAKAKRPAKPAVPRTTQARAVPFPGSGSSAPPSRAAADEVPRAAPRAKIESAPLPAPRKG